MTERMLGITADPKRVRFRRLANAYVRGLSEQRRVMGLLPVNPYAFQMHIPTDTSALPHAYVKTQPRYPKPKRMNFLLAIQLVEMGVYKT